MLDAEIKEQLKQVFSSLEKSVGLVYHLSSHAKQSELVAMLQDVSSASPKISARPSGEQSQVPAFFLERDGKPTGVAFRGIPGGHEFTSLVLAILNADEKGKVPDGGIAARIRNLKGPIRIKTYISLTCENCPDVVQALNQMALLHPDFQHEMVDGSYAQGEITSIGIQGVPSIAVNSKMIHSGRIHFLDLLTKLEEHFGTNAEIAASSHPNLGHFDVVVVGGGPAGAAAAIYSSRKGLKTALLAERMGGQVQDTKGIENLVSVVYTEGPELAAQLYKHVASYPITVLETRRVKKLDPLKNLDLEGGEKISGDAIIITTGAKWRELGVPGEKEYLGRGVAYCPHCDGPFYKGKKIAVIGGGNSGVEAAIDLAGIAGEVVLLEYADGLKADQILVDKLNSLQNASVIRSAQTRQLVGDSQKIVAIEYMDRKTEQLKRIPIDGVFVQIGLLPNSDFAKETIALSKFGEIIIDEKCRTNVPGVYAAGDVTTVPYKQIVIAMGEGSKAALAAFEDKMHGRT
ncbi:MAG: alkyl hydroperoxide reductase subunit F [Bdellovibrionales bacterium]|nr:alkyl hydroperoxide reductase subunit F [Bdellovibrionales bacterium]